MKIISPAFKDQGKVPPQYTCDGIDVNPPLEFLDVPIETVSLLLVVDDPDAVSGRWIHWLIWNISPEDKKIEENSVPPNAIAGLNSFNRIEWGGPCPPSGKHGYIFKLYALDSMLDISPDTTIFKIEQIIKDHIITQAELLGYYQRK